VRLQEVVPSAQAAFKGRGQRRPLENLVPSAAGGAGRGALTLYAASPQEHLAFAKHLTAEVQAEEFVAGRGRVTKWERKQRNNHWLDALYQQPAPRRRSLASQYGWPCATHVTGAVGQVDRSAGRRKGSPSRQCSSGGGSMQSLPEWSYMLEATL